jgi:hypothetical protein
MSSRREQGKGRRRERRARPAGAREARPRGKRPKGASEVSGRSAGSDLVIFPELFLSGYDLEAIEALAVDPVRDACARIGVAAIVGCTEALPNGGVANSAV